MAQVSVRNFQKDPAAPLTCISGRRVKVSLFPTGAELDQEDQSAGNKHSKGDKQNQHKQSGWSIR